MSFYIPVKAREWFKYIKGSNGFEIDFDIYYFCLMAGLSKTKKDTPPHDDTAEIIQYFPKEYQPNRHLIIALFLNVELAQLGISLSERKALDNQLKRLINPTSPTSLSDEGMKELNKYAFGGFKELQNHFPERPRTLDSFLIGFYYFINS